MRFKKLNGAYELNKRTIIYLITFLNSDDTYLIDCPIHNDTYLERRINDIIKSDIHKSRDTMQLQMLQLNGFKQYFNLEKIK